MGGKEGGNKSCMIPSSFRSSLLFSDFMFHTQQEEIQEYIWLTWLFLAYCSFQGHILLLFILLCHLFRAVILSEMKEQMRDVILSDFSSWDKIDETKDPV